MEAAHGIHLDILGAKIAIRPPESSVEERLGMVGDLLTLIARARGA
jgi:hypothetical protein